MLPHTRLTTPCIRLAMILAAIGSFATSQAATYDVKDFGAVYGSERPADVEANDRAVLAILDRARQEGGAAMAVTGALFISQPIVFPYVEYAGLNDYGTHFAVLGNGADARIVYQGKGPAIVVGPFRFSGHLPGFDLRQRIADICLDGGGIKIDGGGKCVSVSNVRVIRCPKDTIALEVENYDGGQLQANVHENDGLGFRLAHCHHTWIDLTSRVNEKGGEIFESILSGRLYCESNHSLGLDCDLMMRSQLAIWLEANGRKDDLPFQARRRNCWGNMFMGQDQHEGDQGWDDDAISRQTNFTLNDASIGWRERVGKVVSRDIDLKAMGWPDGAIEVRAREGNSQTIVIKKDAFAAPFSNEVRLRYAKLGDVQCDYKPGDWFLFSGTIEPMDEATREYFLARSIPMTKVSTNSAHGLDEFGQTVTMPRSGAARWAQFVQAREGKEYDGWIYPFFWPDFTALIAHDFTGPDRDLTLRFTYEARKF